jgi:hypothetical protein
MWCSYYPQSLVQVCGAIREIEVWIWRSWAAGDVHPELPRLHRSDRCSWPVWPVQDTCGICLGWTSWLMCLWVLVLLISSWSVWSCFVRFCEGLSFRAGCVFGGVFVPGPREVTEALWNACCAADAATGLTGAVHRSDRCHRSDQRRPSVWPVQHRHQAVQVSAVRVGVFWLVATWAMWAWPTWVVSRTRVLEAAFVLLESPSPSRRIFIGSHSLPPSLVRRIVPSGGKQRLDGKIFSCATHGSYCLPHDLIWTEGKIHKKWSSDEEQRKSRGWWCKRWSGKPLIKQNDCDKRVDQSFLDIFKSYMKDHGFTTKRRYVRESNSMTFMFIYTMTV